MSKLGDQLSTSSTPSVICPACSARLLAGELPVSRVILCANCGTQFRTVGDWPVTRISRKAIASLALGIVSMSGMCVTGIPALLLGLWALSDIGRQQRAEILTGRRLAIVGAALGGLFSLVMFALPLLVIIPLARERDIAVLSERALSYARNENWRDAAGEYAKVLERDPADEEQWLRAAPLYVRWGDENAYRRLCEDMLARFGDTQTPHVAERVAKACLLAPTTEDILQAAARLAKMAATQDPSDWAILYSHVAHGLAQYRRGECAAAIEACGKCRAGDPTGEVWFRAADARLIEAMAYFRLGQTTESAAALDQARAIIDSHPLQFGASWHDELICRILLDEAEATIVGAEPHRNR